MDGTVRLSASNRTRDESEWDFDWLWEVLFRRRYVIW